MHEDTIKTNLSEFVNILGILQSIPHSCRECAEALDTDLAGATTATEKTKKVIKRFLTFNRIPALLAEIHRKAEQLL